MEVAAENRQMQSARGRRLRWEQGGERCQKNVNIESESGVTPLSSNMDSSFFASQLSSFGGGGAGGNGFVVEVGGSVGEGGGSSEIL